MNEVPENRRFPRLGVNCEIGYRPIDAQQTRGAVVKNISGSGILLVAAEPPEPGVLMEITVDPGSLSIPSLNAVVEVVRVEPRKAWDFGENEPPGPCYSIGARIVSMN